MKAVIYLRVSTEKSKDREKSILGQDPENQLLQINQMIFGRGLEVIKVYKVFESASKHEPKEFKQMMESARKHEFDVLVVWSLDRFTRLGPRMVYRYIEQLEHYKVAFVSFTEQWLDTLGPWKDMVLSMLATMGKQESLRISERVKAGIERVKKNGGYWGRIKHKATKEQVVQLREVEGLSWPKIAKRLKCSQGTAINRYREARPNWTPSQKSLAHPHLSLPVLQHQTEVLN